jgi:hypothetical protein
MNAKYLNQIGEATIEVSGLQIWVCGRQFPNKDDFWDGNWLKVSVHCSAQDSSV